MIRLFLCDTRALTADGAERKIADTPAVAGVLAVRESVRRVESAAAYILLAAVAQRLGFGKLCELSRGECGKPYVPGGALGGLSFNLSHRPGAALLMLSDEGECGCDIEGYASEERLARIDERLLSQLDFSAIEACSADVEFCLMNESGEIEFEPKICKNDNYILHIEEKTNYETPALRWTALEAALKMSGGGFGDLSRVGEIFPTVKAASFEATVGEGRYAISAAVHRVEG